MKSELALILVFKKHWKLFLVSLCICLALGSFAVIKQNKLIKEAQDQGIQTRLLQTPETKASILKIRKYKQLVLPDEPIREVLEYFKSEDKIQDYRLYARGVYFDMYAIFYEQNTSPLPEVIQILESHPAIIETMQMIDIFTPQLNEYLDDIKKYYAIIQKSGFFESIDSEVPDLESSNNRPINKHYIYLDRDRIASSKGYRVSSTEVIKNHHSLNSGKIWGFMGLCSIMISIFIVFGWESFLGLRAKLKNSQS